MVLTWCPTRFSFRPLFIHLDVIKKHTKNRTGAETRLEYKNKAHKIKVHASTQICDMFLVLVDPSRAYNNIDHDILLDRLENVAVVK